MAQQKTVRFLSKNTVSIRKIGQSLSNVSKSLSAAFKSSNFVSQQTNKNIRGKRKLIRQDSSFFSKRLQNIRRKDREDMIEASSSVGPTNFLQKNIFRSTKGFLGRILDFFGIILIGWLIRTLPSIIRSATQLITNIQKVVSVLTNFIGNVGNVVLGFGEQLGGILRQISGYEIDKEEKQLREELEKAEGGFVKLNEQLLLGFNLFQDPETFGLKTFDISDGGTNQWWDVLNLFPNPESEEEQEEEPSTDEKNEVEEDESEQNKPEENIEGVEVAPKPEDLGSGSDESFSQNEIDDEVQDNAIQEAKFDKGGEVKGVSGIDQIPAKLTKGEFVIQKAIAEKNKEFLKMFNSGKLSPIKESINEAKQGIDLDAFKDAISNFKSDEMMSGINAAMDQVGKLPFDKLNDFPIDEFTKDIESIGEIISPKIDEAKTKVDKINSGRRKPKTTVIMMNNVINRGSGSSSSPQMVSTSKKSTPRSGSSLNMVELVQLSELSFT